MKIWFKAKLKELLIYLYYDILRLKIASSYANFSRNGILKLGPPLMPTVLEIEF
jgi:hypothetical protein